jgi:transcriptional regulator with XRE-family HTH domain
MRCRACAALIDEPGGPPLCPACLTVSGADLQTPQASAAALWLWTAPRARDALATRDLGVIVRAWREVTGTSQKELAQSLGYDPTYISMIETGRREIVDITIRRRFARYLGVPAHLVGVTDTEDADHVAMLQFGHSTLRLAVLARRSGHGSTAVNELWPLVARLEARAAEGLLDRDMMILLARARAELGVSLGYILPEERLPSAVRWTGRALRIAERLDDPGLHAYALRVHGNELRKVNRNAAAFARLSHAAVLAPSLDERASVLIQLTRVARDCELLDATMAELHRISIDTLGTDDGLLNPTALREAHLRGLLGIGRVAHALRLLERDVTPGWVPPQWRVIEQITIAQVLTNAGDIDAAQSELVSAITEAERHRLPHQLQRAARAAVSSPPTAELAHAALARLGSVGRGA